MTLENLALFVTNDFPIRHEGNVHDGKVRSVYWLTAKDSQRVIRSRGYNVPENTRLGVMLISDRISAFDVIWQGGNGLMGIPGKGADLNTISEYWFNKFDAEGLAGNHLLEAPHPLAWIVQKAEPILVEGVARQYITGSMWRDYSEKGIREFCGNILPERLVKNQLLPKLLYTPTTKGNLGHIPGIPNKEDAKISREIILRNWKEFGFKSPDDVDRFEGLIRQAYDLNTKDLADVGQLLADDKKDCGYVIDPISGELKMIYIDELTTPDSSRIWDANEYSRGKIVESCKEPFRQFLLGTLDREVLLDDNRMEERRVLARTYRVPVEQFMRTSTIYREIAEKITGEPVTQIEHPRQEILDALSGYGIVA